MTVLHCTIHAHTATCATTTAAEVMYYWFFVAAVSLIIGLLVAMIGRR